MTTATLATASTSAALALVHMGAVFLTDVAVFGPSASLSAGRASRRVPVGATATAFR
jgi:hypothetical protein